MQTRWSLFASRTSNRYRDLIFPRHLRDRRSRLSYSYSANAQNMEPGKYLQVAVVGVGGVGTQVVEQLIANPIYGFQVRMLQSTEGLCINPAAWKDALNTSETPVDLSVVKSTLQELVKQGEKTCDVAEMYPALLSAGINVVTPNKKAFSGEASKSGRYLHESTVGAGLPIISTLRDLVETGDKVVKIEGVFSGTMSYIFNNFSSGYTEPNPADDLNGADVARKLAILARIIPEMKDEQGNFPLLHGYQSVETTSLIQDAPASAVSSGDEFMKWLPEQDAHFSQMREQAANESSVLRYVGVVDVKNKVVKAELAKYPKTHPFATSLGGSDNIIMFHTERYGKRPLIVQGAGAGNDVTAMGVMSDVLKLIRP
ncbi:homoserine dehydrogenase-domain-containing protein [Suillus lakei]|nr:homoserine dehydrogenase-domain-containing protein [Suillus lakei]